MEGDRVKATGAQVAYCAMCGREDWATESGCARW